jgi:hypothetical protein
MICVILSGAKNLAFEGGKPTHTQILRSAQNDKFVGTRT